MIFTDITQTKNEIIKIFEIQRPKILITLNACPDMPLTDFQKAVRHFLKNIKLDTYLYCYEQGKDKNRLHVHIISSREVSSSFSMIRIRKSWGKILTQLQFINFTIDQACHTKLVSNIWLPLIRYVFKEEWLMESFSRFGGSSDISAILRKYKLTFSSKDHKLDSNMNNSFTSLQTRVQELLKDDTEEPVSVDAHSHNKDDTEEPVSVDAHSHNKDEVMDFRRIKVRVNENIITKYKTFANFTDIVLNDYMQQNGLSLNDIDQEKFEMQLLHEYNQYNYLFFEFDIATFSQFLSNTKGGFGRHYMNIYLVFKQLFVDEKVQQILLTNVKCMRDSIRKMNKSPEKYTALSFLSCFDRSEASEHCNSRALFFLTNGLYKIFRSNSQSKISILDILGHFIDNQISVQKLDLMNRSLDVTKKRVRLGNLLYGLIFKALETHQYVRITELYHSSTMSSAMFENDNVNFDYEEETYKSIKIVMEIDSDKIINIAPDYQKSKTSLMLEQLSIPGVFVIPPKNWKPTKIEMQRDGSSYYRLNNNYTGGFLLNNLLIYRPLCKSDARTKHSLFVGEDAFRLINKTQEISYSFDENLLDFYAAHENKLLHFLNKKSYKEAIYVKNNLKREYTSLMAELESLRDLQSTGSDVNFHNVFSRITENRRKYENQHQRISDHDLHIRLLKSCIPYKNSTIYFSYEFDFRMRLYPCPSELSYMSHKFCRSLIRFSVKKEFDLLQFQLYAVNQYIECKDLDQLAILHIFDSELENILLHYQTSTIISKINTSKEPYMLFACACEYTKFVNHKQTKQGTYFSNFPIYYDCTAQGPQLLTLFFSLNGLAKYLNLCKATPKDKRNDFYTSIINNFLAEQRKVGWSFLRDDYTSMPLNLSLLLRKSLKNCIMTIFYGVGRRKFTKAFYNLCIADNLSLLQHSFNVDSSSLTQFAANFASLFWDYTHDTVKLPLFQLTPMLREFAKKVNPSNIEWSVFGFNVIQPRYMAMKKLRVDTTVLSKRNQFVFYEILSNIDNTKQKNSFLANFTHSMDAYILCYLLLQNDFPIMAIHDSFGIHSCNAEYLRENIKNSYNLLRKRGYTYFLNQMAELIERSASTEAKEEFLKIMHSTIKLGDLSGDDILNSYHLIAPA